MMEKARSDKVLFPNDCHDAFIQLWAKSPIALILKHVSAHWCQLDLSICSCCIHHLLGSSRGCSVNSTSEFIRDQYAHFS